MHGAEDTWFFKIAARLDAETTSRVPVLVGVGDQDEDSVLSLIKAVPAT